MWGTSKSDNNQEWHKENKQAKYQSSQTNKEITSWEQMGWALHSQPASLSLWHKQDVISSSQSADWQQPQRSSDRQEIPLWVKKMNRHIKQKWLMVTDV